MDIKSEISGKVWKIEAAPGTEVEEEDAIIILESMKMEIPVPAPKDGKVTEILVEEEELVEEGQVVARMDD
jgi:acetyl-CoA carboxylase biotin carboxyl carrier protein